MMQKSVKSLPKKWYSACESCISDFQAACSNAMHIIHAVLGRNVGWILTVIRGGNLLVKAAPFTLLCKIRPVVMGTKRRGA